jgi:hypothetical protein
MSSLRKHESGYQKRFKKQKSQGINSVTVWKYGQVCFSNASIAYRVLLTIPVTVFFFFAGDPCDYCICGSELFEI